MFKRIIFILLSILVLSGLIYVGLFLRDVPIFAKGENTDSKRTEIFKLSHILENGDIIFQTSKSSQSKAIQLATNSKYSHMGIIYRLGDKLFVYEAIQPVKLTPLKTWIARGENQKYVVKRLRTAKTVLNPNTLIKMKSIGDKFLGKDYDIYFEWSNDKIYCSELVWKIYKEALNIEIGHLETLKDFNLNNPIVKQKLNERYGDNLPLDEMVISPKAMYDSDKLKTVLKN